MSGEAVAIAALSLVGTPFALRGRVPGVGLDCIGTVVLAHRAAGLEVPDPRTYRGRAGMGPREIRAMRTAFHRVRREDAAPGDMVALGDSGQTHYAVLAELREGELWIVHADDRAAIGRVVLAPIGEHERVRAVYRHRALIDQP